MELDLSGFDSPEVKEEELDLSPFAASPEVELDLTNFGATPAAVVEPVASDTLPDRGQGDIITRADLEALSDKYKVSVDKLRSAVGWFSGVLDPRDRVGTEHLTEGLKSTVGSVGEMLPFIPGLPQKEYIAAQSSPEERAALDELRSTIESRKSKSAVMSELIGSIALPAGSIAKLVKGAPLLVKGSAMASEALITGAVSGYAHSKEGEEMEQSMWGAGIGLAFIAALGTAGAIIARKGAKAEQVAASKLGGVLPPDNTVSTKLAAEIEDTGEVVRDTVGEATKKYVAAAAPESILQKIIVHNDEARRGARSDDIYKFLKEVEPEDVRKLSELGSEKIKVPRRLAKGGITEDQYNAYLLTRAETERFDRFIGASAQRGGVASARTREGATFLEKQFENLRKGSYIQRELEEFGTKFTETPGILSKGAMWFSDLRFVTDMIDRRLGTRITPLAERMSSAYNKFTSDITEISAAQKYLQKMYKKAGTFDLYAALEQLGSETSKKYTPAQQDAIAAWRSGFDSLRKRANKLGLNITHLADEAGSKLGYVPHMTLDTQEFYKKMYAASKKVGVDMKTGAGLEKLINSGDTFHKEYIKGLELASGEPIKDIAGAIAALNKLEDTGRAGARLDTLAGSALERTGSIPPWLLERDPSKLMQKWAQSVFRHVRLRETISEARMYAESIQVNHPQGAEYVKNWIMDVTSVREGTVEAVRGRWNRDATRKLWVKAQEVGPTSAEGRVYRTLGSSLDQLPKLSNNVYSFSLGGRVDKVIENFTSPFLLGLPSIGYQNSKHVVLATLDMVKHFFDGRLQGSHESLSKFLTTKGLAPADQPFEAHRWMREGLNQSKLAELGSDALNKFNQIFMKAFQKTDEITRGITYYTAKRLAAEIADKGTGKQQQVMREMSPGYKFLFKEALAKGEDTTDLLSHWLNGYTQFNYNRVTMSAYGREMGSLFSTFSKWPTAIAGDVINRIDRKMVSKTSGAAETKQFFLKYVAPYALLMGAQKVFYEDYVADSPRAKQILGTDLAKPAPLSSLVGFRNPLQGGPALRGAIGVGLPLAQGDVKKATGAAVDSVTMFMPFGAAARFLYKDWPEWTGEDNKSESLSKQFLEEADLFED